MADRFIFKILFNSEEVTAENVTRWFQEALRFFEPEFMTGTVLTKYNHRKYNARKFFNGIEKELTERDIFTLSLEEGKYNYIEVLRGEFHAEISWGLTDEIYEQHRDTLLAYMDDFFQEHQGIVAFACSGEDFFWQNNDDINQYKIHNRPTDHLRFKESPIFEGKVIVDVENNPGHYHIARDIWFISCWAMWYGREFFKYIPKEVISSFREGLENKELKDGSIRILLHENIWDYDKPENREIQWAFRRQTGIDEVAHSLSNEPIREENPNPSIHIFQGEFEHGGVRVIHYYFNEKGELVTKSKATERRIYELDQEGRMVWSKIEKL